MVFTQLYGIGSHLRIIYVGRVEVAFRKKRYKTYTDPA